MTTNRITEYRIRVGGARFSAIMNRAAKLNLRWNADLKVYVTTDADVAASFERLGAEVHAVRS